MSVCTNTLNMPLVVTLMTGPPGLPGTSAAGNWYLSQFTGDSIKSSFYPIAGYSTTDAARYEVVIDGVQQEPNYSFDILADNGGTILFPEAIYTGARISIRTQNT
jgi:hypothetical protein